MNLQSAAWLPVWEDRSCLDDDPEVLYRRKKRDAKCDEPHIVQVSASDLRVVGAINSLRTVLAILAILTGHRFERS